MLFLFGLYCGIALGSFCLLKTYHDWRQMGVRWFFLHTCVVPMVLRYVWAGCPTGSTYINVEGQ